MFKGSDFRATTPNNDRDEERRRKVDHVQENCAGVRELVELLILPCFSFRTNMRQKEIVSKSLLPKVFSNRNQSYNKLQIHLNQNIHPLLP